MLLIAMRGRSVLLDEPLLPVSGIRRLPLRAARRDFYVEPALASVVELGRPAWRKLGLGRGWSGRGILLLGLGWWGLTRSFVEL
jgi:hypothetical protein